jgi:hypothetical protein
VSRSRSWIFFEVKTCESMNEPELMRLKFHGLVMKASPLGEA